MHEARLIRWFFALILASAAPLAMAGFGLSVQWGAHPWWAMSTALIGVPVGLVAGLVIALLPRTPAMVIALVSLGLAAAVAVYGKTQFAASYAEDVFAGKLWYFGWIGIAAGVVAVVLAILAPRRGR